MATAKSKEKEGGTYIETVGRRKTSVARVRLMPARRTAVTINGKEVHEYFPTEPLRVAALEPLLKVPLGEQFSASVVVRGGGITGQAIAVRHAISRALILHDGGLRGALKKEGFLKRDPRAKERRKFGLKKARKAPQWSKR
jgi:small subunit ribosomal protein S9